MMFFNTGRFFSTPKGALIENIIIFGSLKQLLEEGGWQLRKKVVENRQMLRESDRKTTFEKICEVPITSIE